MQDTRRALFRFRCGPNHQSFANGNENAKADFLNSQRKPPDLSELQIIYRIAAMGKRTRVDANQSAFVTASI
jgi:hypothetical protein